MFYHRLRQIIAAALGDPPAMEGEIEVDESYFGGHRKGKRGRGAAGKVLPVFGAPASCSLTPHASLSEQKPSGFQWFAPRVMPSTMHCMPLWLKRERIKHSVVLAVDRQHIKTALKTSGLKTNNTCGAKKVSCASTFICF